MKSTGFILTLFLSVSMNGQSQIDEMVKSTSEEKLELQEISLTHSTEEINLENSEIKFGIEDSNVIIGDNQPINDYVSEFNARKFYFTINGSAGGGDIATLGLGGSVLRTINDKLQIGVGIQYLGNYGYYAQQGANQQLPITADIRYAYQTSKSGRGALLVNLSTGYNVLLNSEYNIKDSNVIAYQSNGLFLNPSLGFRFNVTKNLGAMLDLGYVLSKTKSYEVSSDNFIQNYHYDNFLAKFSIFF